MGIRKSQQLLVYKCICHCSVYEHEQPLVQSWTWPANSTNIWQAKMNSIVEMLQQQPWTPNLIKYITCTSYGDLDNRQLVQLRRGLISFLSYSSDIRVFTALPNTRMIFNTAKINSILTVSKFRTCPCQSKNKTNAKAFL